MLNPYRLRTKLQQIIQFGIVRQRRIDRLSASQDDAIGLWTRKQFAKISGFK
jgi:hypothetical protein